MAVRVKAKGHGGVEVRCRRCGRNFGAYQWHGDQHGGFFREPHEVGTQDRRRGTGLYLELCEPTGAPQRFAQRIRCKCGRDDKIAVADMRPVVSVDGRLAGELTLAQRLAARETIAFV